MSVRNQRVSEVQTVFFMSSTAMTQRNLFTNTTRAVQRLNQ